MAPERPLETTQTTVNLSPWMTEQLTQTLPKREINFDIPQATNLLFSLITVTSPT